MRINSEQECIAAIEKWKSFSPDGQVMNLKKAIEGLELDQMYYQGKGSEAGDIRCGKCLELLNKRIEELKNG